jgi:heme oxygenase
MAIREIISEATRTSHRRLDLALSSLDLGRPDYYEGFLRGQAEALFPTEAALTANGIEQLLPDWPFRVRTPALEHDLAAMTIACHPQPPPEFRNTAEMLGAVYVLEASRMGARVMLARLAEHPDSDAMNATAYLRHGFGKRFWPSFLDVLESHPDAQADTEGLVNGAAKTFAMFEKALTPTSVAVDFVRSERSNYSSMPG